MDIYNQEREEFITQLKSARFMSVMIDGATDSSNLENEIVYVKFFNENKGVLQYYLGIEDIKHANAQGVLSAIDTGKSHLIL